VREVQDPDPAPETPVELHHLPDPGILRGPQVHAGKAGPVVPPQGHGVALDEFQEALQDGLLQAIPPGESVGVRVHEGLARVGDPVVERGAGNEPDFLCSKVADRRPQDLLVPIPLRDVLEGAREAPIPLLSPLVLRFAEKEEVLGPDGVAPQRRCPGPPHGF
jgi:hypothetical protein